MNQQLAAPIVDFGDLTVRFRCLEVSFEFSIKNCPILAFDWSKFDMVGQSDEFLGFSLIWPFWFDSATFAHLLWLNLEALGMKGEAFLPNWCPNDVENARLPCLASLSQVEWGHNSGRKWYSGWFYDLASTALPRYPWDHIFEYPVWDLQGVLRGYGL